jgi:hypothetical protein
LDDVVVDPVVDPVDPDEPVAVVVFVGGVVVDPVDPDEPVDVVVFVGGVVVVVAVWVTVTVTSSLVVNAPSFAIRRKTYTPLTGKVTAVLADCGDAKLANALPLYVPHSNFNGLGRPSSVAVPLSWMLVPTDVALS